MGNQDDDDDDDDRGNMDDDEMYNLESGTLIYQSSLKKRGRVRQIFTDRTEYTLTLIGTIIGLGNIWRFPFLVFIYGGGK